MHLADRRETISDRSLTFLLAAITAIAPLVMQMYLPALPSIGEDLGSSAKATQLTFSAFVFAVGAAQLVYGPLSDHFGRRNTAIASMVVCLVGSVGCAIAPSIGWLVFARIIQAIGSAGGMVISRAILSDRYGHSGMAARLSSVIVVIVVVPMIAPLIGGYLTAWQGWRSVFLASAAFILAVLIVASVKLPETRVKAAHRERLADGAAALFKQPLFVVYTLQSALSLAVFYTFIAVVPYVMENTLNLPPTAYGQYFITLAMGYMLGTLVSSKTASSLGIVRMVQIGTAIGFTASMALFAGVFMATLAPWVMFGPMMFLAAANGFASPSMQSGAVLQSEHYAGTASGIVGCAQQLLAGVTVQIVALWGLNSPGPMAVAIIVATSVTIVCTLMLPRLNRQVDHSPS